MNPKTLLRIITFVNEGSIKIGLLARNCGLGARITDEIINLLLSNNIGRLEDDNITFQKQDKIKCAILAVKMGCDLEEASIHVGWRDFENMVSEILLSNGYTIKRNYRLRKPRSEIDILAFKQDICIAIDCKQWKRTVGESTMTRIVEQQIERTEHLTHYVEEFENDVKRIYPVLITLFKEDIEFIDRVPIVPISKITGFIREFEGYSDSLNYVDFPSPK